MTKTKETICKDKDLLKDYIKSHTEAQMKEDATELIGHIETLANNMTSLIEEYPIASVMHVGVHLIVGASDTLLMEAQLGYKAGFNVEGKMRAGTD